ncbi:MAG: glycoside hydrolase family 5 protein [Thermoguttaceae bacterium]|nr:glycoside hydrolase family 5 protein [Thermoguttaceae bacterium]MDW8038141.1 cellulase family glycosylhydrolase [Thermoguttaceae bacterium]
MGNQTGWPGAVAWWALAGILGGGFCVGPARPNLAAGAECRSAEQNSAKAVARGLEPIRRSPDGRHFVLAQSGKRFLAWGFNYDHDEAGRLLEDYWQTEWDRVVEDFQQMKQLGANLVRVHLQVGRFLDGPHRPNKASLEQLARLVQLAEQTGLYLDITGLGCYHKKEVPGWYDQLPEPHRWRVQGLFWEAVARTCARSPAVFCYDLMNEPVLPAPGKKETDWLLGEFGGKYFVQRISLDLAGRKPEQVARAWVDNLVDAIRKHDKEHLITVGEIPWATVFPGARSLFHTKEVGDRLDFVSVHFYPEKGQVQKALKALAVYQVGKPLVIEEMFPLRCSLEELDAFVEGSRELADGWIGFFWGKMPAEYAHQKENPFQAALMRSWLEYFQSKSAKMARP